SLLSSGWDQVVPQCYCHQANSGVNRLSQLTKFGKLFEFSTLLSALYSLLSLTFTVSNKSSYHQLR
ncbi:hypothetical protein, partial [Shewanella sp. P1-14-1]|uniref:hypothetical protein n=1 Tax=Shewanella sp. P1-14-1 TaxID=1723761 RepID=UPI001F20708D